ncbi:MAG: HlyC/CorC family transporter [SAR324 cluster bacterium]|nr:HlyC/CorC family transporter [SAR324 cluster bacterium]
MEYYLATVLIVLFFIFLEGFFSGTEIGLVSADKTRLRFQAKKGSKAAALIMKLFQKPEWILVTTLTGTNISIVTATTITTAAMLQIFPKFGDLIAVLVLTPCSLFFAEIVSKSIFQQKADQLATKVIYPLYFISWLLSPFVFVMATVSKWVSRLVGVTAEFDSIFVTKDELKMILEMAGDGSDVLQQERNIIYRLFEFSEISAKEIMLPLVDTSAVSTTATVEEAIDNLKETDLPWVFVYSSRIDLITGYIDFFDLLNIKRNDPITTLVKPVHYIPSHKKIHQLLTEMQEKKINFCVIVDEYGGAEGIITIEDILEEVVGDIASEHEKKQPLLKFVGENKYIVRGRVEIHQFEEAVPFDLQFPDGDYATVGGFVLSQFDNIPLHGDQFKYKGYLFRVEKADERSVLEVSITKLSAKEEQPLEIEDVQGKIL